MCRSCPRSVHSEFHESPSRVLAPSRIRALPHGMVHLVLSPVSLPLAPLRASECDEWDTGGSDEPGVWIGLRHFLQSLASTLVAAAIGCGGGGGGSPTAPPAPGPSPANISGAWTGTTTTTAISGTCLADTGTAGGLPLTLSSDWVVRQDGSSIAVSRTINHLLTCGFVGTIQGSTFSLRYDFSNSPPACGPTLQSVCTVPRFRPIRLELQPDRSSFSGTVSGSTMTVRAAGISKVYDAGSGQYLGEFESQGVDELRR